MEDEKCLAGGLKRLENGKLTLPDEAIDALRRGQSVIPMNAEKQPLVLWKELQERQPTPEEVADWIRQFGTEIAGWARIAGARSGVIVLDDDTKDGKWFREWGLEPHLRTGSGGLHWIGRHPGWRVKTVNSKTSKRHSETYPLLDVRADGGYSIICGFSHKGGYAWLRDPEPDPLEVLPEAVRDFFGLSEPPREEEFTEPEIDKGVRIASPPGEGPTPAYLVLRALEVAKRSGRNNGGLWLVQQLRDHGYSQAEILELGQDYVAQCPPANQRGELEEYTFEEFRNTVRSVFSRSKREPWASEESVVAFEEFAEALAETKAMEEEGRNGSEPVLNIDEYLVPTEIGAQKQYPPWAIEDVVREGHRCIFYAVPGAAKSYLAVDLCRAAATGRTWLGRKVAQGSVVYVAAEDFLGIHHRVETAIAHSGAERAHQVRVFEKSMPMTSEAAIGYLKQMLDLLPEKPAFFIVDNLSLCMGDGDPNEGVDAKRFIDGCEAIQSHRWRAYNPGVDRDAERPITVVIIHHTNKIGNFNGSQYFENLVDAMSELEWDDKKSARRTLRSRKQRHGERHKPMTFELREVDPVNKLCVVVPRDLPPATTDTEQARRNLIPSQAAILDCLRLAMEAHGEDVAPDQEGLTRGDITLKSKVPVSTSYRIVNGLKGGGLIEFVTYENENGKLVKVQPERFRLTKQGLGVSLEQDVIIKAQGFIKSQNGGPEGVSEQ